MPYASEQKEEEWKILDLCSCIIQIFFIWSFSPAAAGPKPVATSARLRLKLATQINSSLSYFCNFPYLRKHKTSPHLPFFLLLSQDESEAVLILQFSSFLLFKQRQRQIIIKLCQSPFKSVPLSYQSSFITECISLQMSQKLNPILASLLSSSNQPPSFKLPCSLPSDSS